MPLEGECLGCGTTFDHERDACPECGWSSREWAAGGRYGLARPGTGEWDDD
jgi:uncharacterized OB-fold protein